MASTHKKLDAANTKNLVLATVRSLAKSQGLYGRILENIGYNGENYPDEWYAENFGGCKDTLDVVLRIEQ